MGNGQHHVITLESGTQCWLNARSREWSVPFDGKHVGCTYELVGCVSDGVRERDLPLIDFTNRRSCVVGAIKPRFAQGYRAVAVISLPGFQMRFTPAPGFGQWKAALSVPSEKKQLYRDTAVSAFLHLSEQQIMGAYLAFGLDWLYDRRSLEQKRTHTLEQTLQSRFEGHKGYHLNIGAKPFFFTAPIRSVVEHISTEHFYP